MNVIGRYVDISDPDGAAGGSATKVRITITSDGRIKLSRTLFCQCSVPLDKLEDAIKTLKEVS